MKKIRFFQIQFKQNSSKIKQKLNIQKIINQFLKLMQNRYKKMTQPQNPHSQSHQQQHHKFPHYNRNKILTLIGSLLIQFAAGVIPIWGNANLYYLSYFKNNSQSINKNTNSYILIGTVLPLCVCIVFATKLSNKFGYTNVIKSCAFIFFFSHLVIYIKFSLWTCAIFLIIIPITVISISFIPMFHCLWTYYINNKSTITGYVVVSYGIGGVVFNIMFLHMANPLNIEAKLNDNEGFVYFDEQVSNNIYWTTKVIFGIIGMIFIIGAMLIQKQSEYKEAQQQNIIKNHQNNKKYEEQYKHYELKEEDHHEDGQNNFQQIKSQKYQQMIDYKSGSPCPVLSMQNKSNEKNKRNQKISLKKYICTTKFRIIFINVLLIDLYASYLLNNFKLIYIDKINDDHFLGYCLVANTITALIGTFGWGCLGDRLKIGKTMFFVIVADLLIKLFGIFSAYNKGLLMTLMILLGITSRGMSTISGPGLIQVFGLKVATELLPIKALGVIGSFIIVPILQLIFLQFVTPFQFMNILILINFFLLAQTIYFIRNFGSPIQRNNTEGKQLQQEK